MAERGTVLSEGDRAPDFKLLSDTGAEFSRASLKGRPFVLYFYPKDDTSGCTREAIGFSGALSKFEKLGVAVLGVSKDSLDAHGRFRKKHKLRHELGSDPDLKAATAYGVWVEKSMYGRKYMGMERTTFLVDGKGVIVKAWHKVKVPGHVEAVLAAAKTL